MKVLDISNLTWFGKEMKFTYEEGFGPSLRRVPDWLKSVGALEVEEVAPVRCSSSEPITMIAKFEWLPTIWLRVTTYICSDCLQITVCLGRKYESREHMMAIDAAKFVENGRHQLDRLDPIYVKLLSSELLDRFKREPCCKNESGVYGGTD